MLTLACLLAATGLAYPFLTPVRLGAEMEAQVDAARARLETLLVSNRRLESEIEFLKSDEGVETLARRMGYRRPGEVVYRVHTAESQPPR